jgi:hypothetical protein
MQIDKDTERAIAEYRSRNDSFFVPMPIVSPTGYIVIITPTGYILRIYPKGAENEPYCLYAGSIRARPQRPSQGRQAVAKIGGGIRRIVA